MDNELIDILTSHKHGKFNLTHKIYNENYKGAGHIILNKVS